jgi:hypothetical protein
MFKSLAALALTNVVAFQRIQINKRELTDKMLASQLERLENGVANLQNPSIEMKDY